MKAVDLYDRDFSEWALHNAELVRRGDFDEADLVHIAEEIEDLSKSRQRALESAVTQIILHLLKYEMQPDRRSRSWLMSIAKQRVKIRRILRESPSLSPRLDAIAGDSYADAVTLAAIETGIAHVHFAPECPFSLDQILDDGFPEIRPGE